MDWFPHNDWFLHNFVADMAGPEFLLFYASAIAFILGAAVWVSRHNDVTTPMPPPPVPSRPDAYEVAYLRGGDNELVRTVIFGLTQRGYLKMGDSAVEQASDPPDPVLLSPIEREVFSWLAWPRTAQEIFESGGVAPNIRKFSASYQALLQNESLLAGVEMRRGAWAVSLVAALAIVALGGYKLAIAALKGHSNVMFLILMGVAALWITVKIPAAVRVTARGRAYLQTLQLAFKGLKDRVATLTPAAGAEDATLPLLVGLLGVSVLAGTSYDAYHQMFRRASANSTAACGACGGGCGGGCGGCGGCGAT